MSLFELHAELSLLSSILEQEVEETAMRLGLNGGAAWGGILAVNAESFNSNGEGIKLQPLTTELFKVDGTSMLLQDFDLEGRRDARLSFKNLREAQPPLLNRPLNSTGHKHLTSPLKFKSNDFSTSLKQRQISLAVQDIRTRLNSEAGGFVFQKGQDLESMAIDDFESEGEREPLDGFFNLNGSRDVMDFGNIAVGDINNARRIGIQEMKLKNQYNFSHLGS